MSTGGELECYATFIPGGIQRLRAGRVRQFKPLGRVGYSHPHWFVRWLGGLEIRLRRELEEINEKNNLRRR